MVEFSINKLNELLSSLKGLRIKEAVSLRKRLEKEKSKLEPTPEPAKEEPTPEPAKEESKTEEK